MTKPHRVSDNIRAEMARRRLSQIELGRVLGRSQAAVSRRLAGETEFTVKELAAAATWLHVSPASLLGDLTAVAGDAA